MKDIDIKVLCTTRDEELLEVFPRETYGLDRGELRAMKHKAKGLGLPTLSQQVASDRSSKASKANLQNLTKKYQQALETIEALEDENHKLISLGGTIDTYVIEPKRVSGHSEATAVLVASDWHIEEEVKPERINGLNRFNLSIAQQRVDSFFKNGLRVVDILAKDVEIKTIVLALLGDFFSNDIHEEFPEINQLEPIHAAIRVQNMIASGIEFILKNSKYNLVIPCHSGNHARTTKTTRFGAENGHSLEYMMYHFLADHFKGNPRVKFLIADGMHSYVEIYGYTLRFHHGHAIKYGGGVGGIYIPVNKSIAQWNKGKKADFDVFGHFHQLVMGANFICNGSLIGYNAFALSIKADFDKPKQALFLIDKKRGRTCVWSVMVE